MLFRFGSNLRIEVMAQSIADLIQALSADPWRDRQGFTQDIEFYNLQILGESKSDEEISISLREWLEDNQPCLFGRMAAGNLDLLSFCILTDRDLSKSDAYIKAKIERFRLLWKIEAVQGLRSGFIILAASPRITAARPDDAMKALAKRLCFLYLRRQIADDEIYTDRLTLEIPEHTDRAHRNPSYEWRVGVNFFASAGDKRWWHDHRIPAGIAFSMNSVGHMARNGALRRLDHPNGTAALRPLRGKLGIDSLSTALKFAMLTIDGAHETPSGKATWLGELDAQAYDQLTPKCPFAASTPPKLRLKDYKAYHGWYHTDETVPADYFHPDVSRPATVTQKDLDFTYLFDDSLENPDFETTGLGGRVL